MKPLLVLATFLVAGCSALTGDAPAPTTTTAAVVTCPTQAEQLAAHQVMQESDMDLLGTHWTIRMEGTLEGDIGTFIVAVDLDANAAYMSAPGLTTKFKAPYLSMQVEDEAYYARNHNPANSAAAFLEEFTKEDELGIGFSDELSLADYEVTCVTLGGKEALKFRYDKDGYVDETTVERAAPHRPLAGRYVDPALQDNFRVSVSYDRPNIVPDSSLTRLPVTMAWEQLDFAEAEGAFAYELRAGSETSWAPLTELDILILGDEAHDQGVIYNQYRLQAGTYELDEGEYTFADADNNQMLSTGDTLLIALVDGYAFSFYDSWASAEADWTLV
jgi:hypothetical protein